MKTVDAAPHVRWKSVGVIYSRNTWQEVIWVVGVGLHIYLGGIGPDIYYKDKSVS